MLLVKDIVGRVQSKLDDPDGTYITPEYVLGFVNDVYDWLFNKLSLTGSQFSEADVIIPGVAAGSPDLSQYQQPGQPLAMLVQPTMLRWRIPGLDESYFRKANGPLDAPRDLPAPGLPQLDSWAWVRYVIELSQCSTPLDIEVTGSFLFDPLTEPDDPVAIAMNANRVFSSKLASDIGAARGNDKWVAKYGNDADEALDDLAVLLVRARQATTHRVGRISRRGGNTSRLNTNH